MTPNLIKAAPVTTVTTAESLVAAVLTFLVSHGVIGTSHLGMLTQIIAPIVALVLPALFGAVKWRLVSPVQKVEHILDSSGLLNDADLARLEGILGDIIPPLLNSTPVVPIGPVTSTAPATINVPTSSMPATVTITPGPSEAGVPIP